MQRTTKHIGADADPYRLQATALLLDPIRLPDQDPPPQSAEVVIIGAGMGGGTLAWALRDCGKSVLLIERGDFLPPERENWDPEAVHRDQIYKTPELWDEVGGDPFRPGVHYWVGGNTKMYGAALTRMRREEFAELRHHGGISPAWPIGYADLERYYCLAERLYRAHGTLGEDPTEPPHSESYPYPALVHEPAMAELGARLAKQGLHPYHLPMGVDFRLGGRCIRCKTCDGFPCLVRAKSDAEVCAIRPALLSDTVRISTRTKVIRLNTDASGHHVLSADVERGGERYQITGESFVIAAGAANTAAILLRSVSGAHPHGLANSSGQVGRNFTMHNMSAVLGLSTRRNPSVFQKTLAVNDFYFASGRWEYPMGTLQTFCKMTEPILRAARPGIPRAVLRAVADRTVDWWLISEDLPDPENRITLAEDGRIRIRRKPNNCHAHERLIAATKSMLRRAGYPIALVERFGTAVLSHQLGTARMGSDPDTSVVDPTNLAHDLDNLWIADGSVFPAAGANGPSLTIAALALRLAEAQFGANVLRVSVEQAH
jgi:choline dehydrogenase-like flavoprotein